MNLKLFIITFLVPHLASSLQAQSYAGLWAGTASLDSVSEPQSGPVVPTTNSLATVLRLDPPQVLFNAVGEAVATNYFATNYLQFVRTNINLSPTPTAQPATLRLLIHVDANNKASLLKDVSVMTTKPLPPELTVRPVLVTNRRFYADYDGIVRQGSSLVPRRLSTTHFDFAGDKLPMAGLVGITEGAGIFGTNVIPFNAPTNPFKHKYHPDHDNLDAFYASTKPEAYTIERVISLSFSPHALSENLATDYGYSVLEGTYSENVTGLMSTNIIASGRFQLKRISTVPVLNDGR